MGQRSQAGSSSRISVRSSECAAWNPRAHDRSRSPCPTLRALAPAAIHASRGTEMSSCSHGQRTSGGGRRCRPPSRVPELRRDGVFRRERNRINTKERTPARLVPLPNHHLGPGIQETHHPHPVPPIARAPGVSPTRLRWRTEQPFDIAERHASLDASLLARIAIERCGNSAGVESDCQAFILEC